MNINPIRILVRRLTIIDNEGKEKIFPLAVISAFKEDTILSDLKISDFKSETEGTSYLNSLSIKEIGDRKYEIMQCKS